MKFNVIFSIVIVILLIFLFFWALQCHKKTEYEYYANNQMNTLSKLISGLRAPNDKEKDAVAKYLNSALNTDEYKAKDMSLMNVAKSFITGN
jgi:hypothetical protein